MTLQPFFEWAQQAALGDLVRSSQLGYSILESFHLLGICLWLGPVSLINLRHLGIGIVSQTPQALLADLRRYMLGGIALSLATGALLFLSEASKLYGDPVFPIKMSLLALALLFHFGLHLRLVQRGSATKLTASLSQLLLLSVAVCGKMLA